MTVWQSSYVLLKTMIQVMFLSSMISTLVLFSFSAFYCNVHNGTICDEHLKTYTAHKISSQDKATIDIDALLIPSPLYTWLVHDSVPFGPRPTMSPHQPCRLIITYIVGLRYKWSLRMNEWQHSENFCTYEKTGTQPRSRKHTEFLGQ
jgi:hypothetical protein